MLQTDQQFPGLNSMKGQVTPNADGSYDIYFGPEPPEGKVGNWIQTIPGRGFSLFSASTARWSPGSIKPGGPGRSKRWIDLMN
jgi:hypothetical protein